MRWSKLFVPTLRSDPSDTEVPSHRLLLRAGFIRQLAAGIYSYLPLARRSLRKIERILRQEMDRIEAQEFHLPALHPAELWKQSGRWGVMGDNMFRLEDRTGRELCLGMTHEEVFTSIARDEIRSYRDLPQIWYQIQTKFRDEPRPRFGLLRVRQFTMKDSYSFDLDDAGLEVSYRKHEKAYRNIFDRCGLQYLVVEAESGAMGGSESHEFMVPSQAGEDVVVTCQCGYASNLQKATSAASDHRQDDQQSNPIEQVHTPGRKTIDEVSAFLQISQSAQIKSLVYLVEDELHLILLRGDHQLNEDKLIRAVQSDAIRPAREEEIRQAFGADPGSLGPIGLSQMPVLADLCLKDRKNMVCGANRDDYHLKNVTPGEHFSASYWDLRLVEPGDACSRCAQPLRIEKAVEIGHIFKLGNKYSKSMQASVLDREGREVAPLMGSYGIGLERILVAAVELYHDSDGIVWPRSIAPFEIVISLLRPDDTRQQEAALACYEALKSQGIDCLLDDREERPGVKFKDAELIGFPVRVTVGKKLQEGKLELFSRRDKERLEVEVSQAPAAALRMLDEYPL